MHTNQQIQTINLNKYYYLDSDINTENDIEQIIVRKLRGALMHFLQPLKEEAEEYVERSIFWKQLQKIYNIAANKE